MESTKKLALAIMGRCEEMMNDARLRIEVADGCWLLLEAQIKESGGMLDLDGLEEFAEIHRERGSAYELMQAARDMSAEVARAL